MDVSNFSLSLFKARLGCFGVSQIFQFELADAVLALVEPAVSPVHMHAYCAMWAVWDPLFMPIVTRPEAHGHMAN